MHLVVCAEVLQWGQSHPGEHSLCLPSHSHLFEHNANILPAHSHILNISLNSNFWHLLIHQYSRQQVMLVAGGGEKRKISNTTFFFPPVSYLVLPTGAFYDFHWENGISCHNRIVIRMETHLKWNPYSPSLTNSIRLRKITIDYIIQCHISLHIWLNYPA